MAMHPSILATKTPMDRGPWLDTVHGATKTQLNNWAHTPLKHWPLLWGSSLLNPYHFWGGLGTAHFLSIPYIGSSPDLCVAGMAGFRHIQLTQLTGFCRQKLLKLVVMLCSHCLHMLDSFWTMSTFSFVLDSVYSVAHEATLYMGILQVRTLERVAIPLSQGSFQLRNWTWVSCIASRFFTFWTTREDHIMS